MTLLLLGLISFLGFHSLRIVAPTWRAQRIAVMGEGKWKLLYSLISIATFVLLIWGYSVAKQSPTLLWLPPAGLRHATALLTLPAFVLLVAAYVPRNHFKHWLGHPMLIAIKLWATAHLLASGWLHSVVIFAAFLIWAAIAFRSARSRPSTATPAPPTVLATAAVGVLGFAAWAGFALWAHVRLMGVAPFG